MLVLGLPLAFSRWIRSLKVSDDAKVWRAALGQIIFLINTYLNLAMVLMVVTGLYLSRHMWRHLDWVWTGLTLAIFALVWVNIIGFSRSLSRLTKLELDDYFGATKRRLRIFSIVHHSCVTLLTFGMVHRVFY